MRLAALPRRRFPRERRPTSTPFGAVVRGVVAGLAGNAAMDATQMVVYRIRGKESGESKTWDDAPAPAQIGKRVWEGVFRQKASPERIGLFNNVVHWTYGPALAALYGIVTASLQRPRPLRDGAVFGIAVWGLGSGILMPAARLAKPPWEYGVQTNALDAGYHLAYGLGTAAAFRALERLGRDR